MVVREYDLDNVIISLVGNKETADAWWDSPNKAFGGDTPNQVFRSEPERIIYYLDRYTDGC